MTESLLAVKATDEKNCITCKYSRWQYTTELMCDRDDAQISCWGGRDPYKECCTGYVEKTGEDIEKMGKDTNKIIKDIETTDKKGFELINGAIYGPRIQDLVYRTRQCEVCHKTFDLDDVITKSMFIHFCKPCYKKLSEKEVDDIEYKNGVRRYWRISNPDGYEITCRGCGESFFVECKDINKFDNQICPDCRKSRLSNNRKKHI